MSESKRIVIVGGVAGGASAAARARRLSEDAEIILFERGEHISFANCGLPYHIGGTIPDRDRLLVQTPKSMKRRFKIDVRVRTEVLSIDREAQEVVVLDHKAGREYRQKYDSLILSPGAEPVRPPIPGVDLARVATLRNMSDMDAIIQLLDIEKPERTLVIGGGYIGLEMAEALHQRGAEVVLVELADQVMGPADPEMAAPLHQELRLNNVNLRLGTSVTEFTETSEGLNVLLSTGETIACGLAVLAIGVRPETTLAQGADLTLGSLGGIAVDERMRTNDPNIYAVGDAVEVENYIGGGQALIPLAGPANRQGRIAADNIFSRDSTYKKTQGTAICKVFNLAIGMTGLSEKALKKTGTDYEKVYVHPASHAGYYPGASPISLKLLFSPSDGKVLGAQAVGPDGIDKRIDVLAVAIRAGLTVFDLEETELSYAPPYGSAKDPINYAGFVAANALRGDVTLCHVDDCVKPGDGVGLLDVRTAPEVATGAIPGAKHIPVDELRDRLDELSRDKEWLVYCQVGLRGYIACRILTDRGFQCKNLTGGYKTYLMATDALPAVPPVKKDLHDDTGEKDRAQIEESTPAKIVKHIEASGLQCPGPIQRLKAEIDTIRTGEALSIVATDPGFAADAPAWCHTTGHELVEVAPDGQGGYRAVIVKRSSLAVSIGPCGVPAPGCRRGLTIVCFSGDFDKSVASFIIANGAAAMGYEVTLFFTFWGLNVLRRDARVRVKKNLIEKMFGFMMPRGAEKLALSKMHMLGMGRTMIKGIMKHKNVTSLPESIEQAKEAGVNIVACTMSMDLMGIKHEELIDGVKDGGVAMYLDQAGQGNVNLFI
jgi:NADPH-dependent 2,4-dienoyl-CoA reductase/sulfur reductase-like enzyme/peroxiredoxin family protein/rhodanese-related sulfurtransferase/TusA-related sulfurtransferase